MGFNRFPTTDGFQQVIFTPVGTIDVIATDRAARIQNAKVLAGGFKRSLAALRRGLDAALRIAAARDELGRCEEPSTSRF